MNVITVYLIKYQNYTSFKYLNIFPLRKILKTYCDVSNKTKQSKFISPLHSTLSPILQQNEKIVLLPFKIDHFFNYVQRKVTHAQLFQRKLINVQHFST